MMVMLAALMMAPQSAADATKKDDPVICKRDRDFATGSHMRAKPVCRHKSEWDYIEKYSQDQLRKIDDRRRGMQPRTGLGGQDGGG